MTKNILVEYLPITVSKDFINESMAANGGACIIPNVILQRANAPNKNKDFIISEKGEW